MNFKKQRDELITLVIELTKVIEQNVPNSNQVVKQVHEYIASLMPLVKNKEGVEL
jgi:hypothetical protein